MSFKEAMRDFGIAPKTIMEDIKKMRLSEVIESIPPRHGKTRFTVPLLYAISQWGDITYGEYLERIKE